MNLENFYNEIIRKLPVVRKNEDFRVDVRVCLSEYIDNVKSLDINLGGFYQFHFLFLA